MVLICPHKRQIPNYQNYHPQVIYQLQLTNLTVQHCHQLLPLLPQLIQSLLLLHYLYLRLPTPLLRGTALHLHFIPLLIVKFQVTLARKRTKLFIV